MVDAMSDQQMSYRLYEAADYLRPYPAYADCDDFDALRLWAVKNNDWQGMRARAVIVSDDGRDWYVDRHGVDQQVSSVRGKANALSQVERLRDRLEGRGPKDQALAHRPPTQRLQHKTIHVTA
jgi:hypothetical protein